jgi:hypothetical protein
VATTTIGRIAGPTATNGTNGENASAGTAVAKNGANGQHATEDGVGTSTGPIPTVTTTVETLTADLTLGDRCPCGSVNSSPRVVVSHSRLWLAL